VLASEVADDIRVRLPRQSYGVRRKLLRIGNIERGGEGRHFADLVRPEELGDFNDGRLAGCEIGDRNGAVASA